MKTKNKAKYKVKIVLDWLFIIPLPHFILKNTRATSNLFDKQTKAGNFIRNLLKNPNKIGYKIKIPNFEFWSHFASYFIERYQPNTICETRIVKRA
jgi:hypothetical protein